MINTNMLIELNVACLHQGRQMVTDLDDETYRCCDPGIYESGIGDHYRHILEHYQMFLSGYSDSFVDYDARARDTRLSTDRKFAIQATDDILLKFDLVDDLNRHLRIKMATSKDLKKNAPFSESTVRRELQYLQAHTIHHFALISMILRLQGHKPPDDFGVAPSTLQYLQTQNA